MAEVKGKKAVGTVDSISTDRMCLQGWVACTKTSETPEVLCLQDGRTIGACVLGNVRKDVLRKVGVDNRQFTLTLPEKLPEGALASGAASVARKAPNGEHEQLRVGTSLIEQERALLAGRSPQTSSASVPAPKRTVPEPTGPEDLAPVNFPVGLESPERDAVLGREGYLFLIGGSNNLRDLYEQPSTEEQRSDLRLTATRWSKVFARRQEFCTEAKIRYVQCIIPEKLTVLRDLIDGPAEKTALLGLVESLIEHEPSWVNVSDPFLGEVDRRRLWAKNDSHLSPYGAWLTSILLCRKLGLDETVLAKATFTLPALYRGDLSRRVFGIGLREVQFDPQEDPVIAPAQGPTLVESVTPPDRAHIGTKRVWRRDDAPFNLRVVAFANSFFDTGENASRISWWASRIFREFHFLWNPNFDFAYLQQVKPDIVIGQTIERFLPRVAKT